MGKISRKVLFFIYKRFKILWILFTIFVLIIFSYINWHNSLSNSLSQVSSITQKIAHQFDFFINDLFLGAYKIPIYEKKNLTCKEDFDPYLRHIVMNHPYISGLAIRDQQNNIICSTLPHDRTFLLETNKSQVIIGPLESLMFHEPVYAIQKRIGEYQMEAVILTSVLKKALNFPENKIRSIDLYDENQKNNVIKIKRENNNFWFYQKLIESQATFVSQRIFATTDVSSLDGILITVAEDEQVTTINLWFNQLLLCLDILVISIFLYFMLKNILTKYYSLHGAIKKAIKSKQFYPVYQPVFDAQSKTYLGAEVLLRWQGTNNEIIMPDFFIEEAEDTGLIVPITLQIIETVFQEAKIILDDNPNFHLSFNICALHFTDAHFFTDFYQLVGSYSISPQQILLEITERDLLDENNKEYITKMHKLREAGYSLAVDDYGTGYSSMSYLQYFPFNYLKIDKLFIHAIGTKAITETLNDAIINLAKKINITIIAEGVETKQQVDYLLLNDVRLLQGWYFSKALSIERLFDLLKGEKK